MLREVTVNIGLERIDIQKRVIVEILLNIRVMGLVKRKNLGKKR